MSRALLRKLQEDLKAGKLLEDNEIVELKSAVQEFIKRKLGESVSYHTARTYLNDLIDFTRFCVDSGGYIAGSKVLPIPLNDINKEILTTYLLPGDTSPHTLFKKWRTLRVFFGWLHEKNIIETNPMEKIKAPRVKETITAIWTVEQVENLLATFDKSDFLDHRNYTIVITLLDTAARVGELVGIRDSDIDWEKRLIRVTGKTGIRSLVFSHELMPELKVWVNRKNIHAARLKKNRSKERHMSHFDETITFPSLGLGCLKWGWLTANSVTSMVIKHAKLAGIPADVKRGPHSLRHTAATWLAQKGVNAFHLQKFLGHSKITTSEIYTRLAYEDVANMLAEATILKDLTKENKEHCFDNLLMAKRKKPGK